MKSQDKTTKFQNLSKMEALILLETKPHLFPEFSKEFQNDPDIILKACQYDIDNYIYVPQEHKNSASFLLDVLEFKTNNKETETEKLRFNSIVLNHIPLELKDNDDIFKAVINYWNEDERCFNVEQFSLRIKNDKSLARLSTSICPSSFLDFSYEIKNDLDMATMACLKSPHIFSSYIIEQPFIADGSLLRSIYEKSIAFFDCLDRLKMGVQPHHILLLYEK